MREREHMRAIERESEAKHSVIWVLISVWMLRLLAVFRIHNLYTADYEVVGVQVKVSAVFYLHLLQVVQETKFQACIFIFSTFISIS